jgi:hypothetical protein
LLRHQQIEVVAGLLGHANDVRNCLRYQDHDVRAIDRASGIVLGWHERDLADREFNLRRHVRRFKKLAPFWVMT